LDQLLILIHYSRGDIGAAQIDSDIIFHRHLLTIRAMIFCFILPRLYAYAF
jgi:hypothetical protein